MNTSKIEKNGKIFMLAYDQGLEHGPTKDFNDLNCDPAFIMRVAEESNASCVTMQYGIAKRFYTPELRLKLPLILKINGKTSLNSKNYLAALTASVEEAVNIGAAGIGFTINPGQADEHIAFEKFAQVRKECEKAGLITAVWSYARGPEISNAHDKAVVAYAVRVAAELGADVIKVKYTGDAGSFAWAVKNGFGAKVVASGTDNFTGDYVEAVREMMKSGASGIAVGRKVWQDENAIEVGKKLAEVIYKS